MKVRICQRANHSFKPTYSSAHRNALRGSADIPTMAVRVKNQTSGKPEGPPLAGKSLQQELGVEHYYSSSERVSVRVS